MPGKMIFQLRETLPWSILILDADEVLAKESKPTLKELAQKSEIWGCYVSVQVHPDWTDNKSLRFFRHLPIFRFKGIFHEQLLKDCPESDLDRSKFVDSDIRIIHTSWRDEDNVKKRVRNISLLKKHLMVYPDDIYQMLDLVRLYLETTNLSGAEELLNRVCLLLKLKRDERNLKQYQAYYFFYTLELFSKKGIAPEKILSVCEEALSSFPRSPLFLFYAALIYYKLKEYDKAGSYFRKCLILRENNSFDQTMIFPKDILGAKSLSGLGHCYFKKRDYSEALKFFQQSHLLQPENKIQAMIQASVSLLEKNRGKSD
jgi:hypothetical protein